MNGDTAVEPRPPVPAIDLDTAPYWESLAAGHLAIQRCRDCARFQHFPTPVCRWCWSFDLDFQQVSGRGEIYTFVTISHVTSPAFSAQAPYTVAWVELREQPGLRVLGVVTGAAGEPSIGDPVSLTLRRITDEVTLPEFTIDIN